MKPVNLDIKSRTRADIASYIYKNKKATKQEIAYELGYSMPTVFQNIKELQAAGIIEEHGQLESTGGRKATEFSIIKDLHYAIGIDITKHHVHMVLLDLQGTAIDSHRHYFVFTNKEEDYIFLKDNINSLISDNNIDQTKVLGVGVSIPGVVDQESMMLWKSHVLELENLDLRKFSQYIPYSLKFFNDANSAAYAELHDSRKKDVVYLALNNSIGGAIYHDGGIQIGDSHKCAEFGHMTLIPGGKKCYCGKQGCVDGYISTRILLDQTNDDLDEFFVKLEQGDQTCKQIWKDYLYYLAITVNNLRMAFDCDIVLGGYAGRYMDKYKSDLIDHITKLNAFESNTSYVSIGKCKRETGAMGCAIQFLDEFFNYLSI